MKTKTNLEMRARAHFFLVTALIALVSFYVHGALYWSYSSLVAVFPIDVVNWASNLVYEGLRVDWPQGLMLSMVCVGLGMDFNWSIGTKRIPSWIIYIAFVVIASVVVLPAVVWCYFKLHGLGVTGVLLANGLFLLLFQPFLWVAWKWIVRMTRTMQLFINRFRSIKSRRVVK